jgi:coenzyme PQQ precursor peptide PqqA
MREWHKPTIEETESGMEVTSYLPAERASHLADGHRHGRRAS